MGKILKFIGVCALCILTITGLVYLFERLL